VKTREINMMIEGETMVVPRIKGNPKEMANKKLDLDTLSGITHWDIFKVVREHPRTANCVEFSRVCGLITQLRKHVIHVLYM